LRIVFELYHGITGGLDYDVEGIIADECRDTGQTERVHNFSDIRRSRVEPILCVSAVFRRMPGAQKDSNAATGRFE
jgi:hypothetical protein